MHRLASILLTAALLQGFYPFESIAQVTEIIDYDGDGVNLLLNPNGVAVDTFGNVFVTGGLHAFKITPGGSITTIIDNTGDGGGNTLGEAYAVATDDTGNVFVTGISSNNAFKITPGGAITQIIDATGDGLGNILTFPQGIAADDSGNVFVTSFGNGGIGTQGAFKIDSLGTVSQINQFLGSRFAGYRRWGAGNRDRRLGQRLRCRHKLA